jgi:hypothetical protein
LAISSGQRALLSFLAIYNRLQLASLGLGTGFASRALLAFGAPITTQIACKIRGWYEHCFLHTLLIMYKTLYIYLGVAAVIGLLTGSILHMSSSILVSVFNLTSTPEETGRSAASVRAAREKKKLEQAWQSSTTKTERGKWKEEPSTEKKFSEWLETDQGLLRQTILEEDDDSEGF